MCPGGCIATRTRTVRPVKTQNRSIRHAAAAVILLLSATIGTSAASATTTPKAKTKLVCKTVKGKRTCTRIRIKATTPKKSTNATDTTIAARPANVSDTTIASAKTTLAPAKDGNASDTTVVKK